MTIVAGIKKKLDDSAVTILADFRGMTVKEITDLKKKLRVEKAEFKIVKNTLSGRAMESEGLKSLKSHLSGPTAIIMGYEDALAPLKVLTKFMADNEKLKIKAGVFEGKVSTSTEIIAISMLPGKKELIAKVVGGIKAPLSNLVFVLSGTIRKLVYTLSAIKDKKGN